MKISFRSILMNTFLFGLGVLLVWLAFRGQNFSEISRGLKNIKYIYVFYALIFILISHILRSLRWNQLIQPLGYSPSLGKSFQALMIGYFANLALPRIGEITRCGILSRSSGAPVESLIGTVITERIWDLFTLILVTFLALIFQYDIISSFFFHTVLDPLISKSPSLGVWIGILVFGILLFFLAVFLWKRNRHHPTVSMNKLLGLWGGILKGLRSFLEIKNKSLFLMYTLGIWAGYALSSWVLFYSVQATSGLGFSASLFILSVGAFGMVAPVQGGIGAYHWMVSHALLLYTISLSSGLVYATVNHSLGVLLIILVGTINLFSFFINNPQKPKLGE